MRRDAAKLGLIAAVGLAAATAQAQLVSLYSENRDELVLGFTIPPSTGDLVIDLGTATQVGVGGTNVVDLIAHGNVALSAAALVAQLNSLYGNMDGLEWGVVGGHYLSSMNNSVYATVAHGTVPSFGNPGPLDSSFNTVGFTIDGTGSPVNQMVTDPTQGYGDSWTEQMASPNGVWQKNATTPISTTTNNFAAGQVNHQIADFYLRTNAPSYPPVYKGYFTLGSDGSLTFTPASVPVHVTPPAPRLSIKRAGNASTISFGTTNGAIYSLYYTNTAGLARPITNWAVSATTITGNGLTNSFLDTSTDSNRVYRVTAH